MTTQYEFQRKENKYLLHQPLAQQLREECFYSMPEAEVRMYKIRSVYFDSEQWTCFYNQVFKRVPRFKVRFRQYGDKNGYSSKGFLEMKTKSGPYTVKHRFWIRSEWLSNLEDPTIVDEILSLNRGNKTLPQVYRLLMDVFTENQLHPVLEVKYDRFSFEDTECRITIDSYLQYSALQKEIGRRNAKEKIDPAFSILEVKTVNEPPGWLEDFRLQYGIRKQSFSKYCFGISLLYDPFVYSVSEMNVPSVREVEYVDAAA